MIKSHGYEGRDGDIDEIDEEYEEDSHKEDDEFPETSRPVKPGEN